MRNDNQNQPRFSITGQDQTTAPKADPASIDDELSDAELSAVVGGSTPLPIPRLPKTPNPK